MSEKKEKFVDEFMNLFSEEKKFKEVENLPTSNITHSALMHQMTNIGLTLDENLQTVSDTTHKKLDQILQQTKKSDINNLEEDNEMSSNRDNTDINNLILNEIRDLRAENKIISNNLEHVKTENALRYENLEKQNNNVKNTVTILISVFGLIISVFFAVLNITVNSINNNIDSLEKNNSMQIQRDVAVEIKNQLAK